jgi:hypothetical protein
MLSSCPHRTVVPDKWDLKVCDDGILMQLLTFWTLSIMDSDRYILHSHRYKASCIWSGVTFLLTPVDGLC